MPKPNILFEVWSPDEVAECLDGVGTSGLYNKLWDLVKHYDKSPRSEVPDDFGDRALCNWWDQFTEEEQCLLNRLAKANGCAC